MAKKKLIPLTPKQHAQMLTNQEELDIINADLVSELRKLKEIFKLEEQNYLNRISNLECSLDDSFKDNERLQTVILTLGGRLKVLELTIKSNNKRFRQNYMSENSTQAVNSIHSNCSDKQKY